MLYHGWLFLWLSEINVTGRKFTEDHRKYKRNYAKETKEPADYKQTIGILFVLIESTYLIHSGEY